MNMSVKILPLMNVLWLGMVLMWVGIIVRMAAEPLSRRRRSAPSSSTRRRARVKAEVPSEDERGEVEEDEGHKGAERDDSYYEDLLEEELKRM
jgi:hypothetical protein